MSSAPLPGPVRSAHPRRKARRQLRLLAFACLLEAAASTASEPPIVEAGEVTVSATRTRRGALQIPGNVTRIDRAAIVRSGATSVPELLRREAGIYVTNTTGSPEGFVVEARGFNNGGGNGCSTLVLLDGRRLNEVDTGCPDWSFVPLEEIEHIEVVRGPASVAYGDNAAAGVIQIFTRRATEDGMRAATQLSTGSYGSQGFNLLVDGRAGGVSAKAFFDHADTNGYRDQSGFDADASHLGLGFDLGESGALGSLRIDGGYDSNSRERPGALTEADIDDDRRQADPGSFGDFDRERARFVQTALELTPSEDVRIRLLPYARRRTAAARLSGDDSAGGNFDFFTDTETDQLGFDSQAELGFDAFGRRHTFLAGGELRREDSDLNDLFTSLAFGDSTTDVKLRRDTWGLFLQQELSLHDAVSLLLGVRRDVVQHEGSGLQDFGGFVTAVDIDEEHELWSPKAALNWRVAEPASLYLSYARGFRAANVLETVSVFGTPPLDPQRSESYEVGAKLREGGYNANLALFWMNVKDEMLFDPFAFENRNLERVRHRGVELSGSAQPAEWLELYASYTYDDVRIEQGIADAGQLPITPRHRGAAGALAHLPYGFELSVDGRWIGPRPLANDLDNSSKDLSSFAVYDARVAWRAAHGPFSVVLEAVGKNLTDREYSEFGGEATFGGPPGFFPSPERSYVLGARIELRR